MSSNESARRPHEDPGHRELNVAALAGVLSSDPVERVLRSGDRIVEYQVTTIGARGRTSVPVSWRNPPSSATALRAGTDVVVVGSIERRFWGGAGAPRSRTEVVAERVVSARATRSVRSMLTRATAGIAPASGT